MIAFVSSLFIVYLPLGFFNVTLAPGGQSRHASYAIRRQWLYEIAFIYVYEITTDI